MPIGDHLRDVMDLYGSPKCPHTNAVLIAAGEKGVDLNCHTEDDWGPGSSVRSMSPLGIGPIRKIVLQLTLELCLVCHILMIKALVHH